MSFRLKTILGIALIEGVLLLLLVYTSVDYLRKSNEAEILKRAQSTAVLLAAAAKDAVLSTDLSTLEALVDEVARETQVRYVEIYGDERVLVSRGDLTGHQEAYDDEAARHDLVAVEASITESGYHFGKVEIGLDTLALSSFIKDASLRILSIAALEMVLVALFSWGLGYLLSRNLLQLRDASAGLLSGDPHVPLPVRGNDEIARTAQAFNEMVQRVEQRTSALEEANTRLAAILETATDGYVLMDTQGVLKEVNPAVSRLFGYDASELIGANVAVLMPADIARLHQSYLDRFLAEGDARVLGSGREVVARRKNGEEFPIELHVSLIEMAGERLFLGLIEDLSEEKRHEAEIKRNESILVATLDASRDAFVTIDMAGRVQEFNDAATQMFGYRREEALGELLEELIIPLEYQAGHRAGLEHFKATGEGPVLNRQVELSACRKDGSVLPVELTVIPVKLDDEMLFASFLRDISERKQRENELKAAKIQAEAGSKAKSRFLATMSHEIRSPLNAVLGSVTLLLESGLGKEQRLYANTAREAGTALLSTINDILDFSKIEAGQMVLEQRSFEPDKLVAQVLQILAPKAQEKGIQLASFINRNVPQHLIGDGQRLRQVLHNLVDNAIKFSSRGTVSVQMWIPDNHQERVQLCFRVQDQGIGMSRRAQKKLFSEFSQVHDGSNTSYKGSGLGLAICAELLKMMDGGIEVESTPGVGTCFSGHATLAISEEETIHFWHLPEHPRVLLLYPVEEVASLIKKQYAQYGVECLWIGNVTDFQDIARVSGRFMLIMIDDSCLMSLDARQCRLLREGYLFEDGNMVALVAGVRPEVQSMLDALGIKHQVNKPLSRAMLLELISTMPDEDAGSKLIKPDFSHLDGKTVLLAEDSPANQLVARSLLEREGMRVDVANNGQEACAMALDGSYDLILMDVRMPIKDGLQASKEILAVRPDYTILAMTANVFKEELDACIEAGMKDVIPKPISRDELLKRLAGWLPTEAAVDVTEPDIDLSTLLNEKVITELEDALGHQSVARMVQVFWQETEARLETMEQRWQEGDLRRLEDEAHTLKSSSGSFGAQTLYERVRVLEEKARSGKPEGIRPLMDEIRTLAAHTFDAMAARFK
ncbi:PAS domain S-box protein [Shewanella sp. 3B26]|uniref:Sensor protein FixL n=1 Tax=Shewanella zhuhaiensis TaxID=2919576 RepID=A0AAJ1BFP5_9GAMM|nr:PAS domain S-box protein [Shewanella zhuhaiensis]MCH4293919.1 PAS domain S-box protein [Shewanella zhuhaiensis]